MENSRSTEVRTIQVSETLWARAKAAAFDERMTLRSWVERSLASSLMTTRPQGRELRAEPTTASAGGPGEAFNGAGGKSQTPDPTQAGGGISAPVAEGVRSRASRRASEATTRASVPLAAEVDVPRETSPEKDSPAWWDQRCGRTDGTTTCRHTRRQHKDGVGRCDRCGSWCYRFREDE